LLRNSGFLALNLGLGAVSGFGALSLITRLYPVGIVGLSAAALAGTSLICSISQLGFNYSLPRFLATSRDRSALINTVMTSTMLVAIVASVVFLALPSSREFYKMGGVGFAVAFIIFTAMASGVNQLELVLVADRAAHKIVMANALANVIKLVAPVIFLVFATEGAYIAQNIAIAIGFMSLTVILMREGQRFRPQLSIATTSHLQRYSAGSYVSTLVGGLPTQLLPLIIITRIGSDQIAYWYTAMAIASLLYQLPGSVGQALLAEASKHPESRKHLMRRATMVIFGVMLPILAVVYVGAPLGLGLLGHQYAAGSVSALRWLVLAGVLTCINYVAGTVLYLAKKTMLATVINVMDAVVVLGLAAVWASDARTMAICWFVGEIGNVILFCAFALYAIHQVGGHWESLGGG
jgi:O-antigen/teichoic acid export membrane protein